MKSRTDYFILATCILSLGCDVLRQASGALGHEEQRAPVTYDVLLDASEHSTGTPETLRSTLTVLLPTAAQRPDSVVRLWTLDASVTARLVAQREVTSTKRSTPKAIKAHQTRWTNEALDYFTTAAAPVFADAPAQKSRIAEALTRIAAADAQTKERVLLYIGDLRETGIIRAENCGSLPDPQTFVARLQKQRLLLPGSMPYRVIFAYTAITAPGDVLCDTPSRSAALHDLWSAAIRAAGGAPEFFITAPTLERSTS
jgi:hypothetical protein